LFGVRKELGIEYIIEKLLPTEKDKTREIIVLFQKNQMIFKN